MRISKPPPWNEREIETCMEALVSQIILFTESKAQPEALADAVLLLPIKKQQKRQLAEIASEIQDLLDVADYDREDDDVEEKLGELKSDFYSVLDQELTALEGR